MIWLAWATIAFANWIALGGLLFSLSSAGRRLLYQVIPVRPVSFSFKVHLLWPWTLWQLRKGRAE